MYFIVLIFTIKYVKLSYYKISLKIFNYFFGKAGLEVNFWKYMECFHVILFHVIRLK